MNVALADDNTRLRRIRRLAAAAIAVAGLINLTSALTPPLRDRLHMVRTLMPLGVPRAATALVALAGLGLLLLSRGVRRGQRRAWLLSVGLLVGSVVLHTIKDLDLEEAVVLIAILGLLRNREAFRGATSESSLRHAMMALVVGGAAAVTTGVAALELTPTRSGVHLPLSQAVPAVLERLVGITSVAVPHRADVFMAPALCAVGFGLAIAAGWMLARPALVRRTAAQRDLIQARAVLRRHGADTLGYFALRDDKHYFFWGDSVVAYGVLSGVCLVSPDPIGPPAERAAIWAAFRRFCDERAWTVAVLGATDQWLPVYRASGMRDMYIGDEAVVDVRGFCLDGGKAKGLRQAVNRVARYGYRVEFYDPSDLPQHLLGPLRKVIATSRRGGVERGFSMTLGRVFDRRDTGLLLAVAYGPDGSPVALCQFVPAAAINGWSLDLMRRTDGEHPNGVTDFLLVETIRHLKAEGYHAVSLNFATMRAVVAGERGTGLPRRFERWLLQRLSDSMQIESLWRFSAKYAPEWRARYAIYDGADQMLPAAMAVARAESFWELPVVGRFLVPSAPSAPPAQEEPVGASRNR